MNRIKMNGKYRYEFVANYLEGHAIFESAPDS
jgi:hypothetical protein